MKKPNFDARYGNRKVRSIYVNTITYSFKNGKWIIKTSYEPIGGL